MFEKILKEFWDWTGYESLDPADEDEWYIPKFILDKMKERAQMIFNKLGEDLEKRSPEELRNMYEAFIKKFWVDLEFLAWGVRQYDEELGRLIGFPLPKWISKGLTLEELEQAKGCDINMQTYREPYNDLTYYLHEIIAKKYNNH